MGDQSDMRDTGYLGPPSTTSKAGKGFLRPLNDSVMNSTKDTSMNSDQRYANILNFKDFRAFKKITNIKERYKIGRVLGEGSFGQVRIALHR